MPAAAEELSASALRVLEENAVFMSYGDDDDVRYFAGPEAVEALAWLVSAVAIPLLVNLASDEVRERRRRRRLTGAPELQPGAVFLYRREVEEVLALGPAPVESQLAREPAEREVRRILLSRGWPEDLAEADSIAIVASIQELLNTDRS